MPGHHHRHQHHQHYHGERQRPRPARRRLPVPAPRRRGRSSSPSFPASPSASSSSISMAGHHPLRLHIDNLAASVSDFDCYSLLPPHVQPAWLDLTDPRPVGLNRQCVARMAVFHFDRLDTALATWIHVRHLHSSKLLSHMYAEHSGFALAMAPTIETICAVLDTVAQLPHHLKFSPPSESLVLVDNLPVSTPASAIPQLLIPPNLLPACCRVDAVPPAPHDVNSAAQFTVSFRTAESATAFAHHLQTLLLQRQWPCELRHPTNTSHVREPSIIHAMLAANQALGEDRVRALIKCALSKVSLAAVVVRSRPLPPAPAPPRVPVSAPPTNVTRSIPPPRPPLPPPKQQSKLPVRHSYTPSINAFASNSTPTGYKPFFVVLKNISPWIPADELHALADSLAVRPVRIHISPETKYTLLAGDHVHARPVKYVFNLREHADAMVEWIREMDARGELEWVKAETACKVCVYRAKVGAYVPEGW